MKAYGDKAYGEVSVAYVETIQGHMWEVLAYDIAGNEIGGRFDTEQEAYKFANNLKGSQ